MNLKKEKESDLFPLAFDHIHVEDEQFDSGRQSRLVLDGAQRLGGAADSERRIVHGVQLMLDLNEHFVIMATFTMAAVICEQAFNNLLFHHLLIVENTLLTDSLVNFFRLFP